MAENNKNGTTKNIYSADYYISYYTYDDDINYIKSNLRLLSKTSRKRNRISRVKSTYGGWRKRR